MASPRVKTRILIISDTHCASLSDGGAESYNTTAPFPPFKAPLPEADLLIHCGDLTHTGELSQYHGTLDMLAEIKASVKIVIAGNHDLSLDGEYARQHAEEDGITTAQANFRTEQMKALWMSAGGRARNEGITYLEEGTHKIDLANGAQVTIYASPYTPEFYDWGFPYEKDEDRFNEPAHSLNDAKNIASNVVPSFTATQTPIDIMVTHGPPYLRMDGCTSGDFAGCPHLLRALMRARPLVHCFGHIHEGWGAERVSWSAAADATATRSSTIKGWKGDDWRAGIENGSHGIQTLRPDIPKAEEQHAAYVDVTERSGKGLRRGEETLLINAAIMDVKYSPVNAPWLVDVDFTRA